MTIAIGRWFGLIWMLGLVLLAETAAAEWVTATGQAEIQNGQYDLARRAAQEDALRQVSWRTSAQVSSESRMEQGQMTLDRVSVQSNAQIRSVRIVDEQVQGNVMKVTLVADVVAQSSASCAAGTANDYRKQVAVLGFTVQQPEQALIGQLNNADRALASFLTHALNERQHVLALEASHVRLYEDSRNAPTSLTQRQTLTQALQTAKQLGVQFVISGIVRDMAVRSPESYRRSAWNNTLRTLGMNDTERAFVVDLFVHDGFSGDLVFQQSYRTSGSWHMAPNEAVGFATDAFWRIEYGKSVQRLLANLVREVDEHLRCLPFMTRITRVNGDQLQFAAGANQGIRPGDELRVYRSAVFYDAQQMQGTELKDVELTARVTQVQPGFAQGEIEVDAGQVNIQPDDVLIAW